MSDFIARAKTWVNQNFVFFLVLATLGIMVLIGIARVI